ncbi:hypothetical protein ACFOEE_16360 [Pseudoalteromonas fenneropenaei]|uniref:ASP external chaperone domain-containing protein n=1 Tax=Pseudoalteromonas fenneropenaei TaxID=1737459 RepID=A0ABV7CN34_9GAMM
MKAILLSTSLVLAVAAISTPVVANTPVSAETLEQLPVQDGASLAGKLSTVDTAQDVSKGQIFVGTDGLHAYQATGEVIIKLSAVADADKVAKNHGLTLKQAYKHYYIVTSRQANLAEVVKQLKADGTIVAASIDVRDLDVSVK